MSRSKRFEADEMGVHARLYSTILNSPAWTALGFSSRALYVQMRDRLRQTNNGNISATVSTLKHAGFGSSSTLAKGLRELETVGLIAKTRQGGVASGGKLCSLYRFTDKPVYAHPKEGVSAGNATHEWKQMTSLMQAKKAIALAHAHAKRSGTTKNALKVQVSNRLDADCEANARLFSSKAGYEKPLLTQNPKLDVVH